jgi:hypothetical protein
MPTIRGTPRDKTLARVSPVDQRHPVAVGEARRSGQWRTRYGCQERRRLTGALRTEAGSRLEHVYVAEHHAPGGLIRSTIRRRAKLIAFFARVLSSFPPPGPG